MPRVLKRSPCSTPVLRYARNRCATFPKISVVSHSSYSQRSIRLPSLSISSRGAMNSEIENTSVYGPQVLTMMPCGMNRLWIRWRLTVVPGVGEKIRNSSVVSASIHCLSLSMGGADGALIPGIDHFLLPIDFLHRE